MIFAYLNDYDPEGFVRLNAVGTIEDLAKQGIVLRAGLRIEISDGDLVAGAVVCSPGSEGIWRAEIVDGPYECRDQP